MWLASSMRPLPWRMRTGPCVRSSRAARLAHPTDAQWPPSPGADFAASLPSSGSACATSSGRSSRGPWPSCTRRAPRQERATSRQSRTSRTPRCRRTPAWVPRSPCRRPRRRPAMTRAAKQRRHLERCGPWRSRRGPARRSRPCTPPRRRCCRWRTGPRRRRRPRGPSPCRRSCPRSGPRAEKPAPRLRPSRWRRGRRRRARLAHRRGRLRRLRRQSPPGQDWTLPRRLAARARAGGCQICCRAEWRCRHCSHPPPAVSGAAQPFRQRGPQLLPRRCRRWVRPPPAGSAAVRPLRR
mmetsp:Transcript_69245/g.206154  ORF Transcript_69245/g.206154 Transcript_69245/m.206154 type:complete len:296 (+) Transcript_69245:311-1198(+)